MPNLSIFSNPIWRTRGLWSYHGPANAPTLWDFDANGYASPSGGRQLSAQEQTNMNAYNGERAQLNEANRAAVDAIMGRFLPISDVIYNQLPDPTALQFISDSSWLADHQQGSDFYNNPANYEGLPGLEFDYQADYLYGRWNRALTESCLAVDYSEVDYKVSTGVSTPIVIDLQGDGIETTSFLAGPTVLFDIDGDNAIDRTAWLSGKDAFLAVDKNGNGTIDGVNELFGGPNRGDGFASLIEFDSNGDGSVNQDDERFSELLLWQDKNVDGITDDGELANASIAGLSSISTNYTVQNQTNNGNILGEVSSAVFQGFETTAVDVYFRFSEGAAPGLARRESDHASLVSSMANFSAGAGSDVMFSGAERRNAEMILSTSPAFIG
ncbi:MAG: hypothetical protein EON49_15870 [Acidovorax sp.]|nr:MAG: hypothetical protein EON49_15870 [Acidovorax sp.]